MLFKGLPLRVGTTVAARSDRGRSRSSASTTSSFSPPATQPSRSATQAGGKRDRSSTLAYPDHDNQSPHRRASTPAEAHACVTAAGCCLTSARSISTRRSSGSSAPTATRSGRSCSRTAAPCDGLHTAATSAPGLGPPCHVCTPLPRLHTAATSAPRLGPPLPHLRRDWARPFHICAGTGPAHSTSAPRLGSPISTSPPGLGPPLPHLRRDCARPSHICAGTGPAHSTSAPRLGPPLPHLHRLGSPHPHLRRDWARPSHICAGTGPAPPTSALGLGHSPESGPPRLNGTECLRPHCLALPRVRLPGRAPTHARSSSAHEHTGVVLASPCATPRLLPGYRVRQNLRVGDEDDGSGRVLGPGTPTGVC